jgi:hypothetical protein
MQLFTSLFIAVVLISTSYGMPRPQDDAAGWSTEINGYCKEIEGQVTCASIVAGIMHQPAGVEAQGVSQAKAQKNFCKEGYRICTGDANNGSDGCNNGLSRCLTGDFSCNAWGSRPAPATAPPADSEVFKKQLSFCKDDEPGSIGCEMIKTMTTVNDRAKLVASLQLGFCRPAYLHCKTSQMGDCINSLSRCMSGSWNCNALGNPNA